MENRAIALRYLSEAISMDSNGFQQGAFAKYLQSLHVLTLYLNEMFKTFGFQNIMVEKKREMKKVLCMIHECSDRLTVITDGDESSPIVPKSTANISSPLKNNNSGSKKSNPFQKVHDENMLLMKRYQWRFERSNDKSAKTNLRLELERQLVENQILAKKKYDVLLAVKEFQKERVQLMEKEMKKLLETPQRLSEKQKEKQELYLSVLQYAKNETWPCTWELNAPGMSAIEAATKIFQKTIRCSQHPLSQWIIVVHTNIKREIETTLKKYSEYQAMLPEQAFLIEENPIDFKECTDEFFINSPKTGRNSIAYKNQVHLLKFLESISSEIVDSIQSVLEIFFLIYKSLLPDDSEEECHKLIEAYILDPVWPKLIVLFRISNLPSEYKVLQTMIVHQSSTPEDFGFTRKDVTVDPIVFETCVSLLNMVAKSHSMSEKLKLFVRITQNICGTPFSNQGKQKIFGADDLMPLLCYVVTKSKLPQLSSECCAIEQLFDMNYMFGEEGYALSSFLTAVKYIEIRKIIDDSGEHAVKNMG